MEVFGLRRCLISWRLDQWDTSRRNLNMKDNLKIGISVMLTFNNEREQEVGLELWRIQIDDERWALSRQDQYGSRSHWNERLCGVGRKESDCKKCKMERGSHERIQIKLINGPLYRDASGCFTEFLRKWTEYRIVEELDEFDSVLLKYTDRGRDKWYLSVRVDYLHRRAQGGWWWYYYYY